MSDILFKKSHIKALKDIEDFVCKKFSLKPGQMYAPNRRQEITHARFTAYYLLRYVYHITVSEIGVAFNKDHTTVGHGINFIEKAGWADEIVEQYKSQLSTYPQA